MVFFSVGSEFGFVIFRDRYFICFVLFFTFFFSFIYFFFSLSLTISYLYMMDSDPSLPSFFSISLSPIPKYSRTPPLFARIHNFWFCFVKYFVSPRLFVRPPDCNYALELGGGHQRVNNWRQWPIPLNQNLLEETNPEAVRSRILRPSSLNVWQFQVASEETSAAEFMAAISILPSRWRITAVLAHLTCILAIVSSSPILPEP